MQSHQRDGSTRYKLQGQCGLPRSQELQDVSNEQPIKDWGPKTSFLSLLL